MRIFKAILRYSKKSRLILAMVFGLAAGVGSTILLALINQALFLFNPAAEGWLLWGFISLCILVAVARVAASDILQVLGSQMACEVQVELSQRILRAPLRRLEEHGAPKLLVALTDDIRMVTGALMMIPIAVVNAAVVAGGLVYMAFLSWKILAIVIAFMVLGSTTYYLCLNIGIRRQREEREKEDELYKHFHGVTEGIHELKIRQSRRNAFYAMLRKTAEQFRDLRVLAQRIFIIGASWGNMLFFAVIGLVVFGGPSFVSVERSVLSGYTLILLYLIGPLQMVLSTAPMVTRANVSLDKIESLGLSLLKEGAEVDAEVTGELAEKWQGVELSNVQHTYHHADSDSEFGIGPLSLNFKPGEMVFIIGGNGSGKTTLVKLLIGLYSPEQGEIRVNGEVVDAEGLEEYRNLFSVVFSDFYLFENLLGLDSPEHDEKARHYLQELQLKHKVRVKNGRFSTVELSQGQRKRLAMLTACLEDRPIFVFDEWAADQDPEFKKVFYYEILPELKAKGKTIIVVSHDDGYYKVSDRVVKLDYGQVIYDKPTTETSFSPRLTSSQQNEKIPAINN